MGLGAHAPARVRPGFFYLTSDARRGQLQPAQNVENMSALNEHFRGQTLPLLNLGWMNAGEIGRRLGIGVRVAGRIAQQRAQEKADAEAKAGPNAGSHPSQPAAGVVEPPAQASASRYIPTQAQVREASVKTQKITRAAGRGLGGFLRPFSRVGGILWLQVTGFFFGLFDLVFATEAWRTHADYASGPQHQRFLIAAGLTLVFGYLCVSAFWRANRK